MGKNQNTSLVPALNVFATLVAIISGFTLYSEFSLRKLILILIGILFLYLLVNYRSIINFLKWCASRIEIFFNIVVEYRRGHLEFLDLYGQEAMYHEEVLLKRIRRKVLYKGSIEVEAGKITNNIQSYNCFNSINQKQNKVTFVYGNKKDNQDVMTNGRQLQFGFGVNFKNCFPEEEESWGSEIKHYTKVYDLRISFDKKNPPRDVDIYQIFKLPKNKFERKSLSIDPLIIKKYNRTVLKVKLLSLKKGDDFEITWKWDRPKKQK